MRCILNACTDEGKREGTNQDSYLFRAVKISDTREALMAAVCDGMGGFEKGEYASGEMVRMLSVWMDSEFPKICSQSEGEEFEDVLFGSWEMLFKKAHEKISSYGEDHGIRLGTTATVMLFLKGQYYIAHVGDSRAYEITDRIIRLTQDQNMANVDTHDKGSAEDTYRQKKLSSILLQGVGASRTVRPVYDGGKIRDNAMYLLCSDGFLNRSSEEELCAWFSPEIDDSKEKISWKADRTIKLLRARGERDDMTALFIRTTDSSQR